MEFYQGLDTVMKHLTTNGAFLTAKSGDKTNTMVISWGFVGFLWAKPCFITVVRPQRYTNEILESADSFTISVPFDTLKEELKICGSKSGRDIDKSKTVEFIPSRKVESPIVDKCDMYYECKIEYIDKLDANAVPSEILSKFYKDDLHHVFLGEIVEAYQRGEAK